MKLNPGTRRDIALSLYARPASEVTLCARLSLTREQVDAALYGLQRRGMVTFSGGQHHLTPASRKALTPIKVKATPTTALLLSTIERHS